MNAADRSLQPRYLEEVFLDEVAGGPSRDVALAEAKHIYRQFAQDESLRLRRTEAERVADILIDPRYWHNELGAEGDGIRGYLVQALALQACRDDDPTLIGQLRRYDPAQVYLFPESHPVPRRCLRALVSDVAQETLTVRAAAMKCCRRIAAYVDLTPVLDEVIGELWAPATGRPRTSTRVDPAVEAANALFEHTLRRNDPDEVVRRVYLHADSALLPQPALRAVAGLLVIGDRDGEAAALAVDAVSRTAVIDGLAWTYIFMTQTIGLRAETLDIDPGRPAEVLTMTESLARNAAHRKQIEWMRRR
ncbi:hypothetical protein AB0M36_30410 [Actinoplanes sp. NPDC051346]|uniref:hypothetical protein n=1 Tax=Actinoplanes sp. NPDC051346 TaxID=3155048 RepID=UPI0034149E37